MHGVIIVLASCLEAGGKVLGSEATFVEQNLTQWWNDLWNAYGS